MFSYPTPSPKLTINSVKQIAVSSLISCNLKLNTLSPSRCTNLQSFEPVSLISSAQNFPSWNQSLQHECAFSDSHVESHPNAIIMIARGWIRYLLLVWVGGGGRRGRSSRYPPSPVVAQQNRDKCLFNCWKIFLWQINRIDLKTGVEVKRNSHLIVLITRETHEPLQKKKNFPVFVLIEEEI